jgi:DNA-binding MarR family transcriptional regulator
MLGEPVVASAGSLIFTLGHLKSGCNMRELYLEIHILSAILAKTTMQALEQRLAATGQGVSGLQFAIMRALSCQEQTISELSEHFMLDPSTLVPAVDALERKQLAHRGRDPNDRRRLPLSLTERGAHFVADMPFVGPQDPLAQGFNGLTTEEREQLRWLLRKLVRHLPHGEEILNKVQSRVQSQVAQERPLGNP